MRDETTYEVQLRDAAGREQRVTVTAKTPNSASSQAQKNANRQGTGPWYCVRVHPRGF